MVNYLLPLLGIFVSVALSIWGYRQIVGARRERIRVANNELERMLIRRIVLELYQPTVDDLSRWIGGTAHKYRIKRQELISETQLLENVFTMITQSDFLTQNRRGEALEHLSPVFAKVEKAIETEPSIIELARADNVGVPKFMYGRNRIPSLIGLLASILGTITVLIATTFYKVGAIPIAGIIGVFAGSLAAIAMIFSIYGFRESGEETSARSAMQSALDFEQEVIDTLRKLRIPISIAERNSGLDFIATLGERKVLVQLNAHSLRPPLPYIRDSIVRFNSAIQRKKADEGIMVTRKSYKLPDDLLRNTKIRIMNLRELRNYMSHNLTK